MRESTVEEEENGALPLETGADASAHDIGKRYIVDKSEPVASSTLHEESKTVMSKLVKSIAPLCLIYDVEFRNLV